MISRSGFYDRILSGKELGWQILVIESIQIRPGVFGARISVRHKRIEKITRFYLDSTYRKLKSGESHSKMG